MIGVVKWIIYLLKKLLDIDIDFSVNYLVKSIDN